MNLLSIFIYVFFIMIGIVKRDSRFLSCVLLFYIWCLIGLNTYTPDYASYEAVFNGTYYGLNMNVGFEFCCTLFRTMGFTYQQFRMIWALIYIALLANFVLRNTKSPNFVFSMMLICPVLLDVSGIRSGAAYLLALNFSMLLKKPTFKNRCLFVVGTLIASTIHITAVFYLIFLLINRKLKKIHSLAIVGGVGVITIFIYSPLFSRIALALYNVTGMYAIQKWLLGGIANTNPNVVGIMSVAVFVLGFVFVLYKEEKIQNCREYINDEKMMLNTWFLKSIGWNMLFLLPIIMISIESRRLFYGALMVFYCATGNFFLDSDTTHVYSITSFKYMLAEIILAIGLLWMYMYSYQSHDVLAVLRDNMIWDIIF